MQGGGAYSANSRPQHVAAAVAYPYLEQASADVPIDPARPIVIGDLGCAGGANEMEPMQRAIDVLRRRDPSTPIEVVHTDLPQNDFGPLFARLATSESYTHGRAEVYPRVVGQTLYGPLFPAGSLSLVWSGITLHWLSAVPDDRGGHRLRQPDDGRRPGGPPGAIAGATGTCSSSHGVASWSPVARS